MVATAAVPLPLPISPLPWHAGSAAFVALPLVGGADLAADGAQGLLLRLRLSVGGGGRIAQGGRSLFTTAAGSSAGSSLGALSTAPAVHPTLMSRVLLQGWV